MNGRPLSRIPKRQNSRRSVVKYDDEESVLYSERDVSGGEEEDEASGGFSGCVTVGTAFSPRGESPAAGTPAAGNTPSCSFATASPTLGPSSPVHKRLDASSSNITAAQKPTTRPESLNALSLSVTMKDTMTEGDDEELSESYVGPSMRPRKYARSAITQSEAGFSYYEDPPTLAQKVNSFMNTRPVALFFMLLIILSTLAFLLETVPELSSDPDYGDPARECPWFCIETVFIFFFTLEYILRWGSANDPVLFPFEAFNIVDVVAIAPYYVELLASQFENPCRDIDDSSGGSGEDLVDLRFIRVIRLARVFRVLKLTSRVSATTVLVATFKNSAAALMVPGFFLLIGIVVWASLMHLAEVGNYETEGVEEAGFYVTNSLGNKVPSLFKSIPDALWWAIVTSTTVGYGDMYPQTSAGKAINSFAMIFGVLFFAMPIAIVGNEFTKAWAEKKRFDLEQADKQDALEADAETSRLEPCTKNWGEKEVKHFRLFFSGLNCTESGFMGLTRAEMAEGTKVGVKDPEKLIPQHFNWALFSAKAKKIASQLATSDFCLLAEDAPDLSGEYIRTDVSSKVWERVDRRACLISCEGHWLITKKGTSFPRLRSKEKHRGSLPSLKTHWLLETDADEFTPSTAKLAPERTELTMIKEPDTFMSDLEFRDSEDGLVLMHAEQEQHKIFVGRKVMGFNSTEEILVYTHPESKVSLKFAPKIKSDPSLVDLAYKVFHMHRAQGPQARRYNDSREEKNTQMYTRDFVVQLYHHLGFARLPTGFRSRAGLKITMGGMTGGREFVFTSDSDLAIYGLGPGSVNPVYIIGTKVCVMNECEKMGQIAGELLVLAQNYFIATDRRCSQRVFLVAYRGTDVRFYSAHFSIEYLNSISLGQRPAEEEAIEIFTYPNRGSNEGLASWPDTIKERDTSNEFRLTFPARDHPLELDVDDNPLRVISIDPIHTPGLQAGHRIHAVNEETVTCVEELEAKLEEVFHCGLGITLTISREYDALDFLNPSERAPIVSLLQRLRQRVVTNLQEDLDATNAFSMMQSPRLQDGSVGSRQLSRHMTEIGLRDDLSTMSFVSSSHAMGSPATVGSAASPLTVASPGAPHPLKRSTFKAREVISPSVV